jgi:hypothetical protein
MTPGQTFAEAFLPFDEFLFIKLHLESKVQVAESRIDNPYLDEFAGLHNPSVNKQVIRHDGKAVLVIDCRRGSYGPGTDI